MKPHPPRICYKQLHAVSELSESISTDGPSEQGKVKLETKGETQGSDYAARQPLKVSVKCQRRSNQPHLTLPF